MGPGGSGGKQTNTNKQTHTNKRQPVGIVDAISQSRPRQTACCARHSSTSSNFACVLPIGSAMRCHHGALPRASPLKTGDSRWTESITRWKTGFAGMIFFIQLCQQGSSVERTGECCNVCRRAARIKKYSEGNRHWCTSPVHWLQHICLYTWPDRYWSIYTST